MTTPSQMPESLKVPTLPSSLLNVIGEYGMARTDRVSELTIQHRWELLIEGIKEYTADVLRSSLADARSALKDRDAEIERLKKDAERLQAALVWLHAVAHVAKDKDYAAVTNAAAAIEETLVGDKQ